jgi:hypothetical protein
MKIEVICSAETSFDFHRTKPRYTPEDWTLHNRLCENLDSYSDFSLRCICYPKFGIYVRYLGLFPWG